MTLTSASDGAGPHKNYASVHGYLNDGGMVPVNMLFSNLKDVMFGMMLSSAGMVPVSCRQASAVSKSVRITANLSYGHNALYMLSDPDKQQERAAQFFILFLYNNFEGNLSMMSTLLIRHSTP